MKNVQWDQLKSERLKKVRGVSFEEILAARLIDTIEHPSRPEQRIMLIEYKNYVWLVPYVWKDGISFLKTLYPSRKYTKICLKKGLL
jgi:uncharacterized DUF497 family protein